MILSKILSYNNGKSSVPILKVLCRAMLLLTAITLPACNNKEMRTEQALVRVNGEEITVLQINDELRRAGVTADQHETATKQLLESLIDRQLIIDEAIRNKIDRTPEVMQAIEHAKAQIIAQAYLESVLSKITNPSTAEIENYYEKHPEYFAERKQFDMQQLVIATIDIGPGFKAIIDSAKSLDDVASWLDSHNVRYARGQLSRSSIDLPQQMLAKLKGMKKGQLFMVSEGENSLLNALTDIKDSPVTTKNAAPQIEQYLINKKTKEMADAEIAHLRSMAKIQYVKGPVSTSQ